MGECEAAMNAAFNGVDINTKALSDLALDIPTGNITTISKERTAERPCVCTENLNPDVVVMKSAKDRV